MAAPEENQSLSGCVWRTIAIAGVTGLALLWLTVRGNHPPPVRAYVSRARTDMRMLATAIEAYRADAKSCPAFAVGPKSANGALRPTNPAAALPTFCLPEVLPAGRAEQTSPVQHRLLFMTLTTPNAY